MQIFFRTTIVARKEEPIVPLVPHYSGPHGEPVVERINI